MSGRTAPSTDEGLRLLGWGVLGAAVALVHNRLWASPNLEAFAAIAANLGEDPFTAPSGADYLLTNLSLPALARALGLVEPHRYATLHLVVLLVGLAVCVVLARRRFGYLAARTMIVVLAGSPGVTVVFQWLGQPDALTFPLGIAMVLVRRRATFTVLALLAGLTHPEQALFAVAVAAAVRALVIDDEGAPRARPAPRDAGTRVAAQLVPAWSAVVGARLVTEVYLRVFDIGVGRPRSDYLRLAADVFVEHHGRAPLSLLYLLWGPLWLVIAAVIVQRMRAPESPDYRWAWSVLAALSLAALLPVGLALDETRVFAVITAPVLAAGVVLIAREAAGATPRATLSASAAFLAIVLVVPGGLTAGADAWATEIPLGDFLEFLRTGEHPGELFLWLLSPFDFVIPELNRG